MTPKRITLPLNWLSLRYAHMIYWAAPAEYQLWILTPQEWADYVDMMLMGHA